MDESKVIWDCNQLIEFLEKEVIWMNFFQGAPNEYKARCSTINYEMFIDIYEARIESTNLLNTYVKGLFELVDHVREASPELILLAIVSNGNESRYVYTDENCTVLYGII